MFLVCGEALYDVFSSPGGEAGPVPMQAVVGGSPLNVAIGLQRLGVPAGFFAGLSTDPLGERLAHHIASEGVATRYLRRKPNPTTLSLVSLGADGVPAYTFYGHAAADISLTADDLPALTGEIAGVHVGSYTLVREPIADTLLALVRQASGRLVTLDPNIRPTVEPDMAVWRRRIDALLPHASVVKVSDEDLGLIYPGEAIDTVAARWRAAGPALVVVTRGGHGAYALSAHGSLTLTAPRINVVDTVGAGDTFQAALIAGLLSRGTKNRADVAALGADAIESILARAIRAAAITCQRRGADLPTAADVEAAE